jgi:uncharacterized RDD family membrane protein YckC
LYCGKCGAEVPEDAERCNACGGPVAPSGPATNPFGAVHKPAVRYAGFWLRAVAFVIDILLVLIVIAPAFLYLMTKNLGPNPSITAAEQFVYGGSSQALAINLLIEMVYWLYFASLESSVWQATIGKRILGLYVTDMKGQRISFARASGRFLGLSLEHLTLFIGFMMAGFTARKQALHDWWPAAWC